MQGGWEDDETVESASKRETVEEAGVRGVLEVGYPSVFVSIHSLPQQALGWAELPCMCWEAHVGLCILHYARTLRQVHD